MTSSPCRSACRWHRRAARWPSSTSREAPPSPPRRRSSSTIRSPRASGIWPSFAPSTSGSSCRPSIPSRSPSSTPGVDLGHPESRGQRARRQELRGRHGRRRDRSRDVRGRASSPPRSTTPRALPAWPSPPSCSSRKGGHGGGRHRRRGRGESDPLGRQARRARHQPLDRRATRPAPPRTATRTHRRRRTPSPTLTAKESSSSRRSGTAMPRRRTPGDSRATRRRCHT